MDDIELDDAELLEAEETAGDGETLYEHFRIEVDKGQVSVRIDKFLAEHQPHSSRNRIQKAADAGFILYAPFLSPCRAKKVFCQAPLC